MSAVLRSIRNTCLQLGREDKAQTLTAVPLCVGDDDGRLNDLSPLVSTTTGAPLLGAIRPRAPTDASQAANLQATA
jgi:hypothetical protein